MPRCTKEMEVVRRVLGPKDSSAFFLSPLPLIRTTHVHNVMTPQGQLEKLVRARSHSDMQYLLNTSKLYLVATSEQRPYSRRAGDQLPEVRWIQQYMCTVYLNVP